MGIILKMNWEKCAIFIDGGYLTKVLKNYPDDSPLDYLKLSNVICSSLKLERLRTYVYHCLPIVKGNNKQDIERKARMQKFISKLRRLPRFEIKLGKLQLIGNQFKQKMVDVLMSLDIATMSYENQIQHVILIAGDSDFVPAIKKAKDYGIITHLYYNTPSIHNELLDEVDERYEITEEFISSCRLK